MMVTGGFYEEMIRNKSICKRVFNLYVNTCLVLNENQGAVTKTMLLLSVFMHDFLQFIGFTDAQYLCRTHLLKDMFTVKTSINPDGFTVKEHDLSRFVFMVNPYL